MPNNINELLNQLIQIEQRSSYLYEAMSAHLGSDNYQGMQKWLRLQSNEERTHAQTIIDYVINRGGTVVLLEVPAQKSDYGTPLETFQQVLKHEQFVTDSYEQAYNYVQDLNDQQTLNLLQDFLREQTEEVAQAELVVGRLKLAKDNSAAVLILDQELGQRQ